MISLLTLPLIILHLDQYSGHTLPEHAMEAHCSFESVLDPSGTLSYHVTSKIFQDRTGMNDSWKIETKIDDVKTEAEFNQVQTWINEAAVGPFKQGTTPCDIGTVKIITEQYPLYISQDCGKKIENQHPSAQQLIAWFRQACSVEGKKR